MLSVHCFADRNQRQVYSRITLLSSIIRRVWWPETLLDRQKHGVVVKKTTVKVRSVNTTRLGLLSAAADLAVIELHEFDPARVALTNTFACIAHL